MQITSLEREPFSLCSPSCNRFGVPSSWESARPSVRSSTPPNVTPFLRPLLSSLLRRSAFVSQIFAHELPPLLKWKSDGKSEAHGWQVTNAINSAFFRTLPSPGSLYSGWSCSSLQYLDSLVPRSMSFMVIIEETFITFKSFWRWKNLQCVRAGWGLFRKRKWMKVSCFPLDGASEAKF